MRWIFAFCCLTSYFHDVVNSYIINVGYIPTPPATIGNMTANSLKVIPVNPQAYKGFPVTVPAPTFSVAVGDFYANFALNMTNMGVPYLLLGNLPSRQLTPRGWFRLAPEMVTLAPIVQKISRMYSKSSMRLFIGDQSNECLFILKLTQSDLDWNILIEKGATVPVIAAQILQLSRILDDAPSVQLTICSSDRTCRTHDKIFNASLQAGIFIGSVVLTYIPPNANMMPLLNYANAGAEIFLLSLESGLSPTEMAKRYLEAVAQKLTGPTDLTSLFSQTTVYIDGPNGTKIPICFQSNGFPCKVVTYAYLLSNGNQKEMNIVYDVATDKLESTNFIQKTEVRAIAFQNYFMPNLGHSQSSVSKSMMEAIFGSSPSYVYTYQATQVSQNGNLEAQFLKDMTAQDYTISAFPLTHAKNAPLNLKQTSSVLLDSVVIVGMAFPTNYRPFEIFAPFDGYVWLLILISLIVIAAIFLVIQEVSERQRRNLGVEGTVEETSHFSQIRDAIFRNFSAILLAKLNLRPKMPSIRVLYQFYWFNALIMVVTFAAMLAARRLIMPTTGVFFNSLTDLLDNKAGVRWFFLQNSSVYALSRASEGGVLAKLYTVAQTSWPNEMVADSVYSLSQRVQADSNWVAVLTNFEGSYLLKTQCNLKRLNPVENLFEMNFYMHGPSEYINFVQQRIDALLSEGFFGRINNQLTAPGQCPQEDERSELRATPFNLSDMSGLFFVLLAGLLLALLVELIVMVREKCTLYRQRAENKLGFGEEYKAEVVSVADDGIWIRIMGNNETYFVETSRIHSKTNRKRSDLLSQHEPLLLKLRQPRGQMELGTHVNATFLGNDPISAKRIFTVTEATKLKAVPLTPMQTPQPE